MARCRQCGTTWLARVIDGDPYRRPRGPRLLTAAGPAATAGLAGAADVSDAIVIEHVGPGFAAASPSATPRPRPAPRWRKPPPKPVVSDRGALKLLAAAFAVVVAIMVLRVPLVAAVPQLTGGLSEDAAGLEFQRVRSETVEVRGVSTLFVEAEIVNRTNREVALPAVRISLRSADGGEVRSWLVEPSAAGLGAGRSIGFRSALAAPPETATQVTLKLAQREGLTIGPR